MSLPSFLEPLGDGVFAIDTGFHRPRYDASYLLVEDGRAAFVDTGTAQAVPRLLGALEALGLAREAVDWVLPTHVHLDHAGGVGALMQALPAARVLVHPRGLRHLVDPADLYRGALAVYGQAVMDRDYGQLVPVDPSRIAAVEDGGSCQLAARPLVFAHTAGHARHHHCIHDARSAAWFTGDTFGMSYPEFVVDGRAFMFPTTTPVQFEPEVLHASIDRLLAAEPRQMLVTHYARVGDPPEAARRLKASIDDTVRVATAWRDAPDRTAAITRGLLKLYADGAQAHGVTLPRTRIEALLTADADLNARGLEVWLDRPARAAA
jgi:glyoxylase-like metal-dependent hydrolase (beta-lactamase superfamily II)